MSGFEDGPEPAPARLTLLYRTDRGVRCAGDDGQSLPLREGVECCPSRRGNSGSAAVVKSFFGTLKFELIHRRLDGARNQIRLALFEHLEVFYNR